MSEAAVGSGRAGWRVLLADAESAPGAAQAGPELDARRALQLGLAGIWLLDGVLQYQPSLYTTAFGQMLAGMAAGNPAGIARPITWQAGLLEHHLALLNTIYATIQLLLGLGIAMRPAVRLALAASVAWSIGVWWFGEGLGGVLTGTASPLNGAPGAVILYALLAVLLWSAERGAPASFLAARAVGGHVARALWLVLWLSLAYFAVTPANRAPQAVSGLIGGRADGEPGWLAALVRGGAALATAGEVVFGLMTAWFAGRAGLSAPRARGARGACWVRGVRAVVADPCTLHAVHSVAMLYMYLALRSAAVGPTSMGATAMGTPESPTLAGTFALVLVGYSVWNLDQLSGRWVATARVPASRALALAPGTRVGWQVVLGVTMAFMLLIMI